VRFVYQPYANKLQSAVEGRLGFSDRQRRRWLLGKVSSS